MQHRLAFPIRVAANGRLSAVEHDSPADIAQSVALLVSTRPGERRSVTDYGIPDPLFGGIDADEIAESISTWEERADPAYVDRVADDLINQVVSVFPTNNPVATEEAV